MNISQKNYKKRMKGLGLWGLHRGNRAGQSARYREKYPEKSGAHQAIYFAKIKGVLIKLAKCQVRRSASASVAHHDNYKHKLKVKWVCYQCHNNIHNKNKTLLGGECPCAKI